MRILFCSFGNPGFLFPLIGLASELRVRGHQVAFVASEDAAGMLRSVGFERVPRGNSDGPSFHVEVWAKPLHVAIDVKHAEHAIRLFRPDLLVSHVLCLSSLICRERLGIPLAVMGLMAYPWPLAPGTAPSVSEETVATRQWRLDDMGRYFNECRQLFHLRATPPSPTSNPFLGDMFLLRSVPELQPDVEGLPKEVRLIGAAQWELPVHNSAPDDGFEWSRVAAMLDAGRPMIYVHVGRTFGRKGFWPALVEGLAGSDVNVVASVGRADADLGKLPSNFFVGRHAPQVFIIPHSQLVLSGGFTTPSLGAISFGRPTVVFPTGGETKDNGELLERAGCGVAVQNSDVRPELFRNLTRRIGDDRNLKDGSARLQSAFGKVASFGLTSDLLERMCNLSKCVTQTECAVHVPREPPLVEMR